jgi:hypothetical protein
MRLHSDCCDAPLDFDSGFSFCADCGEKCEAVPPKCGCGSNKERYELKDARGISCGYVCDDCVKEKMDTFRPEVFEDSHYDMPEADLNPEFFD